jgi:hypothetical protein
MSYLSISKCVADGDFQNRVIACVADEGHNPTQIAPDLFWKVAKADDIEGAYEFALNAGTPNPGADSTVISDAMILGVVQPIINPPPPDVLNPT